MGEGHGARALFSLGDLAVFFKVPPAAIVVVRRKKENSLLVV